MKIGVLGTGDVGRASLSLVLALGGTGMTPLKIRSSGIFSHTVTSS